MSKSIKRQRTARRRGRPRIGDNKPIVASPTVAPVSLPLPEAGQAALAPSSPEVSTKSLPLSPNSSIKETAIRIYMMRCAGVSDDAIAQALELSPKTLSSYVSKAGRMGWLDDLVNEPKDRLEHVIMHKVVDNLNEALGDTYRNEKTGMQVKTAVAMKIAEGALFPRMVQQQAGAGQTLMGIKIEIVGGAPAVVREGTILEAPAYTEGEVEEVPA